MGPSFFGGGRVTFCCSNLQEFCPNFSRFCPNFVTFQNFWGCSTPATYAYVCLTLGIPGSLPLVPTRSPLAGPWTPRLQGDAFSVVCYSAQFARHFQTPNPAPDFNFKEQQKISEAICRIIYHFVTLKPAEVCFDENNLSWKRNILSKWTSYVFGVWRAYDQKLFPFMWIPLKCNWRLEYFFKFSYEIEEKVEFHRIKEDCVRSTYFEHSRKR